MVADGQRLEEAGEEAKVRIVVPPKGGWAKLSVDKLGALGEPESLTWLRATTEAMLPRIDLPDLPFEVHPGPDSSTRSCTWATAPPAWTT